MEQNFVFCSGVHTFPNHSLSGMKESAKFDKEFDRGGCIYEGKVDWTVEKGKCDLFKNADALSQRFVNLIFKSHQPVPNLQNCVSNK